MDSRNEDRLQTICALMEDANRCILQAALKGRLSSSHVERIRQMLRAANETAQKLEAEERNP